MTTLIPKFDLMNGGATPTGAVNRPINEKLAEQVSVLDFGADPTGVADSTTAFTNAQTASKNVFIPAGTYLLNGLRILHGVSLIGAGYNDTILVQANIGTPAINCTSDVTVGQLGYLNLSNFSVQGKAGATVASFVIYATGFYAVYDSNFDFTSFGGYQALNAIGATAANIYQNKFKLYAINTTSTTVFLEGCAYSTFDFFLAQCQSGVALDESTSASTFTRLITEGQLILKGNSTYINPTVELIVGTALPAGSSVISCLGSNQVLINPYMILDASSSAKATYAFQPFANTILINPRIVATAALANPFASAFANKWTLIGPGINSCPNTIETIYDNADESKNLRAVSFVGDCSNFTLNPVPHGGKSVQYLAPTTSFSLTISNNTDAMIINGNGIIATATVSYAYAGQTTMINGQTLSIWTANAITAFNFSSAIGVDTSLFPTTLTAGQKITFIYHSATNKFYPI